MHGWIHLEIGLRKLSVYRKYILFSHDREYLACRNSLGIQQEGEKTKQYPYPILFIPITRNITFKYTKERKRNDKKLRNITKEKWVGLCVVFHR